MKIDLEKEIQALNLENLTYVQKLSALRKFMKKLRFKSDNPYYLLGCIKAVYRKLYLTEDENINLVVNYFLDIDNPIEKTTGFFLPYFHTYKKVLYIVLVYLDIRECLFVLGRPVLFDTAEKISKILCSGKPPFEQMNISSDKSRVFYLKFKNIIDVVKSVPPVVKDTFKTPKQESQVNTTKDLLTQQLSLLQLQMSLIQQQLDSMNNKH